MLNECNFVFPWHILLICLMTTGEGSDHICYILPIFGFIRKIILSRFSIHAERTRTLDSKRPDVEESLLSDLSIPTAEIVHNSPFHGWRNLYWADISFAPLRRSSCFWWQPIEIPVRHSIKSAQGEMADAWKAWNAGSTQTHNVLPNKVKMMFWPFSYKKKKSLGYSDLKINLSRCHARSGRKLKTAIGFPGTNLNWKLNEFKGKKDINIKGVKIYLWKY